MIISLTENDSCSCIRIIDSRAHNSVTSAMLTNLAVKVPEVSLYLPDIILLADSLPPMGIEAYEDSCL